MDNIFNFIPILWRLKNLCYGLPITYGFKSKGGYEGYTEIWAFLEKYIMCFNISKRGKTDIEY